MAAVSPLLVIVGETASGKTALAIELAQKFSGEIICADSRTIYRGMDIGTAKPTKKEQTLVPHHLLDIRNPDEKYSVAQFQEDAQGLIRDISNRGKIPIMVGGTGLYVDSVIYNYSFLPDGERDPENPRHLTKDSGPKDKKLRPNTLIFGLQRDKEDSEVRLQQRAQTMIDAGFVNEAQHLVDKYGHDNEALRGSGYTLFANVKSQADLDEATQKFVRTHIVLAKKQRTWFKRNKSIHWLSDPSKAVAITTTFLNNLPS
jgi:tRNA dimethylallyltransferase